MNNLIIKYFLRRGYILFCPKSHNFGGFHESLLWALKFKESKNFKIIINFPFIDINKHYYSYFQKNYGKKIVFKYLLTLSLKEILLSIIITMFGNLLILVCKLKLLAIINFFLKKKINKYKFPFLGFGLRQIQEFDIFSNQKKIYSILHTEVCIDKNENTKDKERLVSFCVKDNNYESKKSSSIFATADINNYKESLNYLISKGFKIDRVGDNTMKNFDFNNQFFKDNTQSKNHFDVLHEKIKNSSFYFGTGASHSVIPDLYNKRKIITNNIDFIQNCISASYSNFAIFKKVFSFRKKKILSIEEIFFDKELFFLRLNDLIINKELVLIENNPSEILDTVKSFLNYDIKHEITLKMREYEELKKNAIQSYKKKNIQSFYLKMYQDSKINIPENFLNTYLFNSSKLDEISKEFVIKKILILINI